jgi:uncharacterized protein (TIGR03435 family)
MIAELTNHLWQSTLFAVAAGCLTVAFRTNKAQVRYWLWFTASMKFLLPFALLMNLGSRMERAPSARAAATPVLSGALLQISQPFPAASSFAPSPLPHAVDWVPIAFLMWACGFAAYVVIRLRGWLRIRAAVRSSIPLDLRGAIAVRSSPGLLEPGVVGFSKPVLLLPAGIQERLTPHQLKAVVAHELCHVRRRDNLTSAMHMLVEAIFWFYPLVWWIGARLIEERERACDEAVLSLGGDPKIYAEGILNVCRNYLESPLRCVSGVTGADLKKRIQTILTGRIPSGLNTGKKMALAATGAAALAMPFLVGVMNAPAIRAQSAVKPKFEVAAIKPCKRDLDTGGGGGGARGGGGANGGFSPGRLNLPCLPLRFLIQMAYVDFENGKFNRGTGLRLEGGPSWIDSERYQITAKAEGNASEEMMNGPMMQALLEDRFQLKIRHETRETPLYALTAGRNGLKLRRTQEGSCRPIEPGKLRQAPPEPGQPAQCGVGRLWISRQRMTIDLPGASLAEFCLYLNNSGRPVIDKTGIQGKFDFHLEFAPDEASVGPPGGRPAGAPDAAPADEPAPPSVFTAIEELGLKLEPVKGPRDFLIIDSIERPSEN